MGESEAVSDRAAIGPALMIETDEIMVNTKDEKDSVESGSPAGKLVSDGSDGIAGRRDHRFNLRARKPSTSAEKRRDGSAQEQDDEPAPRITYLGIHGWVRLKASSTLACGTFHETEPNSTRNGSGEIAKSNGSKGTETGLAKSPSFTGKQSLISNSSKSDYRGDTIAAKKAALRQVVCAPATKSSKALRAKALSKSMKQSKKALKSGSKTAIKSGKKIKLSPATAKVLMKEPIQIIVKREPSPFRPVGSPSNAAAKRSSKKATSGGGGGGGGGRRISCYKSSRTVAMELERQKASGKLGPFDITEITFDDVLLGRGNNLVTYEGNIRYREIVLMHRDRYIAAPRVEKGQIAKKVIETVWSRGGRFLESKNNDQTNWREAELPRLLEKATQALREKHAWKEHPERRDGVMRR